MRETSSRSSTSLPRCFTLPLDDDAFGLEGRLSAQLDELKRGENGRKWISELVPEDGKELVLASVGFTGLVVQVCMENGQAGVPP